jgi:low affinity Fe/Cu permease
MTRSNQRSDPGLRERANRWADQLTTWLGSLWALALSILLVVGWALSGPIFGFSDTWQLFINTTTTVITFWMVFVIQNSANRQSKAVSLKLDEVIRSIGAARNEFVGLDQATEAEMAEHEREFEHLAQAGSDEEPTASDDDQDDETLARSGPTRAQQA